MRKPDPHQTTVDPGALSGGEALAVAVLSRVHGNLQMIGIPAADLIIRRGAKEGRLRSTTEKYFADIVAAVGKGTKCSGSVDGGVLLEIPCEEGHVVEWSSPNRIPSNSITPKLKRLGWRLGRHIRCPEHNGHRKAAPEAPKRRELGRETEEMGTRGGGGQAGPVLTVVPPAQTQAEASEQAKAAKRLVLMALDDYFEIEAGRYKPGKNAPVTDESIAADCGVSVEVVTRLREEFYGPLKEPAEIDQLIRELGVIKSEFDTAHRELRESFDTRMSGVLARIEALALKNGWKK